jgi:hypothetical protein
MEDIPATIEASSVSRSKLSSVTASVLRLEERSDDINKKIDDCIQIVKQIETMIIQMHAKIEAPDAVIRRKVLSK